MTTLGHGVSFKKVTYRPSTMKSRKRFSVVGSSKVNSRLKSYVNKAIKRNEETKYFDVCSTVFNTTSDYKTVAVTLPSTSSGSGNYNCLYTPLNFNGQILGGSNIGYNGSAVKQFDQGTNNYCNYVGDTITASAIKLKMEFQRNNTSANPEVYGLIVKESECRDRSQPFLVGDFSEFMFNNDLLGGLLPEPISFKPVDRIAKMKNWKILKRFKIDWSTTNLPANTKTKDITVKLKNHKQTMYSTASGGLGSVPYKDRIWLILYGQEATGGIQTSVKFQSRMYYKDA